MRNTNERSLRLVGHKGADLIAPGNTVESFHAAAEAGVDTIELDVLWLRDAHLPLEERAPLVVAHDWADAARRTPLKLTEALDAFLESPLHEVEIDVDIKLPGREEEIVTALRERDLIGRAMVSTMELYSLGRIHELAPELRRGWTYPKVTKDWASKRWAKGPMLAALMAMRQRLPGLAAEKLPKFGVESMWVYHPLVSRRLARITKLAGVELIAWTVDDLARMQRLVAAGVDGLVSNDPRLFTQLDRRMID
ncbi:MAG: glycerophosphoryl diester phosphodiesterase [Solirubrobacterales bacterium]|jgi:glycerophosphoryl diester phosphodiesterase|nr:glycerophosphoryl diester phosphodiesterase [Solirubrobacterales bacterium]